MSRDGPKAAQWNPVPIQHVARKLPKRQKLPSGARPERHMSAVPALAL